MRTTTTPAATTTAKNMSKLTNHKLLTRSKSTHGLKENQTPHDQKQETNGSASTILRGFGEEKAKEKKEIIGAKKKNMFKKSHSIAEDAKRRT